jgi:FhuF 2Fe-2S C-terminal domain
MIYLPASRSGRCDWVISSQDRSQSRDVCGKFRLPHPMTGHRQIIPGLGAFARMARLEPEIGGSTWTSPGRDNASVWTLGTDETGLLAELAGFGPFFAVQTHWAGAAPHAPWQPLDTLLGSATALTTRISAVRDGLAAAADCPASQIELRVAASVAQLGIAARLISPVLGSAVLGVPLRIDAGQARWVPAIGGPFPLSLALSRDAARPGRPQRGGAAGPLTELLGGPVRALVDMTAPMVSRRVLWGNVGSAINGAAAMISTTRPPLRPAAIQVSAAALRFPELAGSYRGQPTTSFQRRSCCLIYRIAGNPQYCGDCILNAR